MDNDVTPSPLSALMAAYGADDFLLAGGVIIIVLSSIFILSSSPLDQSAFATFPGENGKIAFRKAIGNWDQGDVYVMNADGSGQTRLTNDPGFRLFPDWSPDGTKIAFAKGILYNNNYEIYVMNADGSGQTKISNGPDSDQYPRWSPDGTKIVFASGRDYNYDIYVMNADGSGRTRLTRDPGNHLQPSWSPDGTKIVFAGTINGGANYDIYVMNADGSGQTRLTTYGDDDFEPDWSPDGTKIVFVSDTDANGHFDIYVMNADGSGRTNLSNDGWSLEPSWSPDGTKIVFSTGRDKPGAPEIYVMNADGSGQTRLTNSGCCVVNDQPDWGPATAVEDTTPPVLTVPEDMVVEATSEQVAQVTFTVTAQDDVDGTATLEEDGTTITQHDDVGGDITIACSPASGSIFPLGDSLVQCSARDASGNFVRGSFTVTVNSQPTPPDTTRPVINVPDDITVEATSPDGATVSFEVSAQDDEDGPTDVECDHNSGETFPIGETVVTCSAEDLAGNRADDKSFTITVQDTISPDVDITEASDRRNGRGEIAEGSTTNMRYIEITFEATDAVGIDSTECSLDGQAFTSCTSPVVYDRLSRSTHQFTVRSTDAAGNTGEDQFTWNVRNPSAAAPGRQ